MVSPERPGWRFFPDDDGRGEPAQTVTSPIVPKIAVFGSVGIALMTFLPMIALAVDRWSLRVRDSMGWLCQPTAAVNLTTDEGPIAFEAANPCLASKIALVSGRTYRLDVQAELPWMDGGLRAGPDGLEVPPSLAMRAATPLRRHRAQPWFELTGRVGHSGREVFPIGSGACHTARSDGELFLYVNDAVFGLLPDRLWAWPYFWSVGRNSGKAKITVSTVEPSPGCESQDFPEAFRFALQNRRYPEI